MQTWWLHNKHKTDNVYTFITTWQIILGDFNSKLSKNSNGTGKFAIHQRANELGEKLNDFMNEFDLFARNIKFKHRKRGNKITYEKVNTYLVKSIISWWIKDIVAA